MRFLLLLASTMLGLTLSSLAGDCESTIQIQQEMRGGKNQVFIKNISEKPIVAYVVTNGTDAAGNPVRSFYGVFTAGDSLHSNASMELGSLSSTDKEAKLVIDYVRFADGTSCGAASTQQAKDAIARLDDHDKH